MWIVEPATRTVHVYRAPLDVQVFGADDELTGGDMLPGFRCEVRGSFPDGAASTPLCIAARMQRGLSPRAVTILNRRWRLPGVLRPAPVPQFPVATNAAWT